MTVIGFPARHQQVPPGRLLDDTVLAELVSADAGQTSDVGAQRGVLGFDGGYLHHVGQHLEAWIDEAGERVLPRLAPTAPPELAGRTGGGTTTQALAERGGGTAPATDRATTTRTGALWC